MKTCKSLVLCGVLSLLVLAVPAMAQNIIDNGDFETGDLTGWEINGVSGSSNVTIDPADNGPTLPGTNSAYMANYAEAVGLNMKQVTPVGSAGEGEVTWSFDLKIDEAGPGGVFFAQLFAEQEGIGVIGGSGLMGPWFNSAWETRSGAFMAPPGTDFITIQFVATTGAVTGSSLVAHVDNVIVEAQGAVPTEASSWSNVKALYR